MKTTPLAHILEGRPVVLACDVSKDRIDAYSELDGVPREQSFANTSAAVSASLQRFHELARASGHAEVLVVAEATGVYSDLLLRVARRLGCRTGWAGAEAVSKLRSVESNDDSKTDRKDARVIHLLAVLGKLLVHRPLDGSHALLREWHHRYESAERAVIRLRCEAHHVLRRLFPDFGFKVGFLFGRSGQALVACYGANPLRLVRAGEKRALQRLRRHAPRIQKKSVARLLAQARCSASTALPAAQAELLEQRLQALFEDFVREHGRRETARQAMSSLYQEMRASDPGLPAPTPGVVSITSLARIVAETGPLSDFRSWRQLLRLAGLNLSERQSGTWRGRTKLSKKGRPALRRIIAQAVLPLVREGKLYGDAYRRLKAAGACGTKAMAGIARKFLKMLWGWARSGREFDPGRVFTCQTSTVRAA